MAAAAVVPSQVSVEEYLRSSYEPDRDYVDGVLEDRNPGEIDHGMIQRRLLLMLCSLSASIEERTVPETRVQVAPTRFRVPDVCVTPEGWSGTRIIRTPPVLCLEVLSPEDRLSRVLRRARDFFEMGVPKIWIFDPEKRKAYKLVPGIKLEECEGTLLSMSGEIALDLDRLFRLP